MPVIGRRELVGHVVALLDEVGGRVLLVGEPGLGKSTVLDAVRAALPTGVRVARAASVEVERRVGLAAAESMARALLELRPQVDIETWDAFAALAEPGLGELPYDERALSVALGRLLVAASDRSPLLLVVDDLHWVDDQSAAVLHGALRRAGTADVRVLAATRGAAPLPLANAVVIALPPLTESSVREIVDLHLGHHLRPELSRPLAAAVGGNPMFALELARALPVDASASDVRLPTTLADRVARGAAAVLPVRTRRGRPARSLHLGRRRRSGCAGAGAGRGGDPRRRSVARLRPPALRPGDPRLGEPGGARAGPRARRAALQRST